MEEVDLPHPKQKNTPREFRRVVFIVIIRIKWVILHFEGYKNVRDNVENLINGRKLLKLEV